MFVDAPALDANLVHFSRSRTNPMQMVCIFHVDGVSSLRYSEEFDTPGKARRHVAVLGLSIYSRTMKTFHALIFAAEYMLHSIP